MSDTEIIAEHMLYCMRQFNLIRIGGVWAVPRSGLIFSRTAENELTLISRMPWIREMEGTITEEQLKIQQQDEYDTIARHLRAGGIEVFDNTHDEWEIEPQET